MVAYNSEAVGLWRSLVARLNGVQEAPRSNRGSPTIVFCYIVGAVLVTARKNPGAERHRGFYYLGYNSLARKIIDR